MGMEPIDFFEAFVIGNYKDFEEKSDCVRRGFNAAVAASHQADHYFNYHKKHNPDKFSKFNKLEDYLKYLSKKCIYFNDIRGIANAYKHLYQHNQNAPHVTVSSAGSIEPIETVTGSQFEIEKEYSQECVMYTNIKTGEKIKLLEALKKVIEMWENEIYT